MRKSKKNVKQNKFLTDGTRDMNFSIPYSDHWHSQSMFLKRVIKNIEPKVDKLGREKCVWFYRLFDDKGNELGSGDCLSGVASKETFIRRPLVPGGMAQP